MAVDTKLARRAALVIAATVGLAVVLTMALAYFKFERTLVQVATSRLSVVVEEVRRKTEFGLTLGLDLAELEDAQALLERAAATAPEVVGLEITDETAMVLFATDRVRVGNPSVALRAVEQAAAVDRHDAADGRFVLVDGDTAILGAEVRNSFGQMVGTVVLNATLAGLRRDVAAVRGELAQWGLGLLALAALVTMIAVHVTLRHARYPTARAGGERPVPGAMDHAGRIAAATRAAEDELEDLERMLDTGLAGRTAGAAPDVCERPRPKAGAA